MNIIYGIPNCDTIKKTRTWLEKHNVSYQFHDYRSEGIGKEKLSDWTTQRKWEELLNKRSTTWKELGADEQAKIKTTNAAIKLMLKNPTIIKRPVIEADGKIAAIGYDESVLQSLFLK